MSFQTSNIHSIHKIGYYFLLVLYMSCRARFINLFPSVNWIPILWISLKVREQKTLIDYYIFLHSQCCYSDNVGNKYLINKQRDNKTKLFFMKVWFAGRKGGMRRRRWIISKLRLAFLVVVRKGPRVLLSLLSSPSIVPCPHHLDICVYIWRHQV